MAARVVYRDRRGRPAALAELNVDGRLVAAAVRTPAAGWIVVEPAAGIVAPWGDVDRLWLTAACPVDMSRPALLADATPVTIMTSVDWARPATLPVVAEPARLPPGAGTAMLNLVARLALERGLRRVAYAGPYPTEALFLSLLECFAPEPDAMDPLARFMAGALAWTPDPFEPCFDDDVYVQRRRRIEKVVWRERTYLREAWGRVRRWAPLRVDDEGGTTRCALWALGRVLEEHLRLDEDGRPLDAREPLPHRPAPTAPRNSVPPAIRDGLITLVIAMSAPALAHALGEEAATLAWSVGPVDRDLVRVGEDEVRIGEPVASAIRQSLAAPAAREPQTALGMLAEIATALGDPLRARAQERLAAASEPVQRRALERETVDDPDAARRITGAVAALLASGGVDEQPDVERDERHDGND